MAYKRRRSWYMDRIIDGKRIHRKVGETEKEAEKIESEVMGEQEKRRRGCDYSK